MDKENKNIHGAYIEPVTSENTGYCIYLARYYL